MGLSCRRLRLLLHRLGGGVVLGGLLSGGWGPETVGQDPTALVIEERVEEVVQLPALRRGGEGIGDIPALPDVPGDSVRTRRLLPCRRLESRLRGTTRALLSSG